MQLLELITALAAVGGVVFAYHVLAMPFQSSISNFWDSQPRVGRKDQWLSWVRSTLKSFTEAQTMVAEGYFRVGPHFVGRKKPL